MENRNNILRSVRDILLLASSLLFIVIYIPHLVTFALSTNRDAIKKDVKRFIAKTSIRGRIIFCLVYKLHTDRYFRTIFYHRIGPIVSSIIGWYRPGDRYFIISKTTLIGEGIYCPHPYATIINAESIGNHFSCRHLTTIGNKSDTNSERPVIGDNVTLGANVTIIGKVHIGNNVTIGAGSVVTKNVPDNCIIAGNPAKIIRVIES